MSAAHVPALPGTPQDCPEGQAGSTQQVSSTQLPERQSIGSSQPAPFGAGAPIGLVRVADGEAVFVAVRVCVAVRVLVAVEVAVLVDVAVDVAVGDPVDVAVAVAVAVSVSVGVGVSVCVAVAVAVSVAVAVAVAVSVGDPVDVAVGDSLDVAVGVPVAVSVAVGGRVCRVSVSPSSSREFACLADEARWADAHGEPVRGLLAGSPLKHGFGLHGVPVPRATAAGACRSATSRPSTSAIGPASRVIIAIPPPTQYRPTSTRPGKDCGARRASRRLSPRRREA